MVNCTNLDDLPDTLLMEILSKLPANSLLQLKSVSKNWCALIDNPFFISLHYLHHSNQSHPLIHHLDPHTADSDFTFVTDPQSPPLLPSSLDQHSDFSWELVGPLNGLFLLYNCQEKAAIWNPCTREFTVIPESGFPRSDSLCLYSQALGFGIDPLCNEYKVVWVRDFWDRSIDNWHNSIVSVYSLSGNSWRHFEDSNVRARNMVKSVCKAYSGGCFYWKAIDNRRVFEFSMRNEGFQEIETPEFFESKKGDLGLYGGCVAMFFHDFVEKTKVFIEIWGLERGKCCWSMKARVGPFVSIGRPLGFGENGEVFLQNPLSKVAVVQPAAASQEIKVYEPMKPFKGCYMGVFDYKESLISISSLMLKPNCLD